MNEKSCLLYNQIARPRADFRQPFLYLTCLYLKLEDSTSQVFIGLGSSVLSYGSVDKDGKVACGLQVQEQLPCGLMPPGWLTSPNRQRL